MALLLFTYCIFLFSQGPINTIKQYVKVPQTKPIIVYGLVKTTFHGRPTTSAVTTVSNTQITI